MAAATPLRLPSCKPRAVSDGLKLLSLTEALLLRAKPLSNFLFPNQTVSCRPGSETAACSAAAVSDTGMSMSGSSGGRDGNQFVGGEDLIHVENNDELLAAPSHAKNEVGAPAHGNAWRRIDVARLQFDDLVHAVG
jgi:hypothetical protein